MFIGDHFYMSFSIIKWVKSLFIPDICGLCSTTKTKKFHILYYRVSDYEEVQEMKICDKCEGLLQDTSNADKKLIADRKKELDKDNEPL